MSTANIDTLCGDCAHMNRDKDGGRWCSAPQVLKGLGHSIRCVWERDGVRENGRVHANGTGKCGPMHVNFKRREFV